MSPPYILFFSHIPQIEWYGFIAKELSRRLSTRTVIWLIGEQDHTYAQSTGNFDQAVNLLSGLNPVMAEQERTSNLAYLADFERRCGGLFYHCDVAMDRHIASRKWSDARIAQYSAHLLRAMEQQLENMGALPAAAFGEANSLPYRLAHHLLGSAVHYWNFAIVRHWDHRFFLDDGQTEQWPRCREKYSQYRREGIPEPLYLLSRDRLNELRVGRIRAPGFSDAFRGSNGFWQRIKWTRIRRASSHWIKQLKSKKNQADPREQNLWEASLVGKAQGVFAGMIRKHFFDKMVCPSLPANTAVASYFLHVQPEHSVETLAFEFRDQLVLIQNIAAFLPANMQLAVKEHPGMIGLRDLAFYRKLLEIPNVILVSDMINSYDLIRRSRIVLTLTGSAALEAMYEGVSVILFGDVFFDSFEGIYKIQSIRDLKSTISAVLNNPSSGACEEAAISALAAMYAASYPGDVSLPHTIEEMHEPNNVALLADAVVKELYAFSGA
ncbi:MAG: hypothetical protein WCC06_03945 [Candidatus Aminicenantales bacterium]